MDQLIASECPEGEAWSFVGSKQCDLTSLDEARALFQREAHPIVSVAFSGSPLFLLDPALHSITQNTSHVYSVMPKDDTASKLAV